MTIRRARGDDGERLREIARVSKGHWDYDPAFVAQWAARLDMSPDAVEQNEIYVGEVDGEIVTWSALTTKHGVWWLDDLWVIPQQMGKGIGTRMFEHIVELVRERGGPTTMEWQAEPNSVAFYEKLGARCLRDSEPTSWGRVLPVMGIEI